MRRVWEGRTSQTPPRTRSFTLNRLIFRSPLFSFAFYTTKTVALHDREPRVLFSGAGGGGGGVNGSRISVYLVITSFFDNESQWKQM